MAQIRSASAELIAFFETGDIPTADNFTDFILSTAVYDGTLPIISGSAVSTGSFGTVQTSRITGSSNITLAASLIPDITNTYSIGSDNLLLQKLQTETAVINDISSSFTPTVDNTFDLGSPTREFKDLYIDGTVFADTISNSGSAVENRSVTIVTASFSHGISSSILPDADNIYDLGSSTKEWKNLFVDGVAKIDALGSAAGDTNVAYIKQLSGSSSEPALTASVTIVSGVDNTYDLGTAALSWKDLHVQGTATIGTLSLTSLANNIIIPLVSQSMNISGSIIPGIDNTFDLGSSLKEFKDLFIDGTANIDLGLIDSASVGLVSSSLIPDANNTYDLGSTTKEWKDLFVDGVAKIDALGSVAEDTNIAYIKELSGSTAAPNITSSVNIIPKVDNTYSLGASGKEFKDLFIDGTANIDLGLIDSASVGFISSSLVPYTDDTYNLGSSTKEWKDLFIDGTANIDTLAADNAAINQHTSNFLPSTNGTLSLGNSSKFWNKLHITNVTASGNISSSLSSTGSFGSMILPNLPTNQPTVTGSLWLSGSAGAGSKFLVVFTGE